MTAGSDDDILDVARKGPDAFRTISEVADDLGLPQHVLRFWESRFPQIKPVKRGGGRRYYRPNDVELLRGVKQLLYGEGYTIRGVQRILREQGGRRLAQAAGRAGQATADDGPETAAQHLGPEIWAAGRRAEPSFAPPEDLKPDVSPYPPRRESVEPSVESAATAIEPLDPTPARDRLSGDQTARLTAALDELLECRRLLAGRP